MKIYIHFNKQRKSADGMIPIYVVVYRSGMPRLYVHSGLSSSKTFESEVFPRSERNWSVKTKALAKIISDIEVIALENSLLPNDELKAKIMSDVFGKTNANASLHAVIGEYINVCKNSEGGKDFYKRLMKAIIRYDEENDTTTCINFTKEWVCKFEEWRTGTASHNTFVDNMAKLCTVCNYAVSKGYIKRNILKDFHFSRNATNRRNLPIEKIKYIRNFECKGNTEIARDLFMLSLYLRGVNGIDIINLKKCHINNGRLEFDRHKTGVHLSIKLEPEAKEIIDRYKGKEYLLYLSEKYDNAKTFIANSNKMLQRILDKLTMYHARHSWATFAINKGAPIELVAAGLGHKYGSKITNIYAEIQDSRLDELNRSIIDMIVSDD